MPIYKFVLVSCIPVSLLPASVDDVSSAECDVDSLVVVVVTVVVSGPTVQTTRYLLTKME